MQDNAIKEQDKTTIQITKETRDKLGQIGMLAETYDQAIQRIITFWEEKHPK